MSPAADALLVVVILAGLGLLGSGRVLGCVRLSAVQGGAVALLTLAGHEGAAGWRLLGMAAGTLVLKAAVFPRLLTRAVDEADVRRELPPYGGYALSLVSGAGLVAAGVAVQACWPIPGMSPAASPLMMPVAFAQVMTGVLLIVSRRHAAMQVLGYLTLENGIYLFGIGLVPDVPVLVELGVLLDIFVAVFIMAIAVHHIQREFDHLDVERLTTLRG